MRGQSVPYLPAGGAPRRSPAGEAGRVGRREEFPEPPETAHLDRGAPWQDDRGAASRPSREGRPVNVQHPETVLAVHLRRDPGGDRRLPLAALPEAAAPTGGG